MRQIQSDEHLPLSQLEAVSALPQGPRRQSATRRRLARALHDSKARFRSAFEHAAIGMALVALDGRFLRVNRSLCDIIGYGQAELLATDFQSITHPDDLDADLAQVQRLVAGESREYRLTKRYLHKDGPIVWAQLSVSLVRSECGAPRYFISQVQDFTAQKRTEAMEADRSRILELVARGGSAQDATRELALMVERNMPNARCAFFLLDNGCVSVIGPTLPEALLENIRARPVSAAAQLASMDMPGQRPMYHDLAAEPSGSISPVALGVGLRGCWAYPLEDGEGASLGVLAVFMPRPAPPESFEHGLCDTVARLASLAMERTRLSDGLARRAERDSLTGLPNRVLFADRLDRAMIAARRAATGCGLLLLDIDKFKSINDTLGHDSGDELLVAFAQRVGSVLRESDTLARLGGDEFAIVLPNVKTRADLAIVATKIIDAVRQPFNFRVGPLAVTTSVGGSLHPLDAAEPAALQKAADMALYRVKRNGRDGFDVEGEARAA